MKREVDSAEFAEWEAYERVNGPIGQTRDDRLTEYLALVIATTAPRRRRPRAKDFSIDWDRPPKPKPEDVEAKVYQLFGRPPGKKAG